MKSELKRLLAGLLEQDAETYLMSKAFEVLCIKHDLDDDFRQCLEFSTRDIGVVSLSRHYTGYHKRALGYFLEALHSRPNTAKLFFPAFLDALSPNKGGPAKDLTNVRSAAMILGWLPQRMSGEGSSATQSEQLSSTSGDPQLEFRRTTIFVGSSRESISLATAIHKNLEHERDFEVTVWATGLFQPGQTNVETLEGAIRKFDFAAMIVSPDDIVDSRGQTLRGPRDNVLFELGLFMGCLGRNRVIGILPKNQPIKLLSDLSGLTFANYDDGRQDGNLQAATLSACSDITSIAKKLGRRV